MIGIITFHCSHVSRIGGFTFTGTNTAKSKILFQIYLFIYFKKIGAWIESTFNILISHLRFKLD